MLKKYYKVKIVTLDRLLGTIPKDREVYKTYIASKAPKGTEAPEAEDIQELEEKGWTGFFSDDKGFYIMNYMVLGFLKEAGNILKEQVKVRNLKSKIEDTVFIGPRHIHLDRKEVDGCLERPLRAQTPKGEITSLARSDYFNEGLEINFQMIVVQNKEVDIDILKYLFNYGELKGLGQFRNGSFGRFKLVSIEESKEELYI